MHPDRPMHGSGTTHHAILDTWRKQGVDLMDPIAFHYMAALQRRVVDHDGDTRRVLESRLSGLIEAYADKFERAAFSAADADGATKPTMHARGALGGLVGDIARQAVLDDGAIAADGTASRCAFPELDALDDFRKIWAKVRSDSQMRRSLARSPTNAGPLNSSSLVHRSITLMRELSPGYLQHFLSYVDALSWLERMNDSGVLAPKGAPQTDSQKTRVRNKPRKRRE